MNSNNFSAKIIAQSISPDGIVLTTMEIEYPRFILAELNTHRMLVKNSSSSRAIPIDTVHKSIIDNTAQPVYWGSNKPGMQAGEEILDVEEANKIWKQACESAIEFSKSLQKLNVHKQVCNRITEPFMIMKTVISGTEWSNFFHLRDHKDAQPEFRYLVQLMKKVMDESSPTLLKYGEWHLPYINSVRNETGNLIYLDSQGDELELEEARKISAACCAQVSYRKLDDTKDKCIKVYEKLMEQDPKHCFIESTEVLTISGFKYFKDLLMTDLIASIDETSLQFRGWEHPINIISRELGEGELIYTYPNIDLGVTDRHKMLGSIVSGHRSRQIYTHSIYYPGDKTSNRCQKNTQGEREALLPKVCNVDIDFNSVDFNLGQLIGFYIGDGFYKNDHNICFRLVKDRKINYITTLLNILGINFNASARINDITSSKNQVTEITFAYPYFDFSLKCGEGSINKMIPDEAYHNITLLSGIFEGLKNSDGSLKRNTWCYSTISHKLKEQIVMLAPLVGLSILENKPMEGCFRLMNATRKYIRINDSRSSDKVIISHDKQKVYCAEISGGALVIRTSTGQTMISGNCSPVEHQACPIDLLGSYQEGVTHITKDRMLWSGPFKGWVQFRKLIPNESA